MFRVHAAPEFFERDGLGLGSLNAQLPQSVRFQTLEFAFWQRGVPRDVRDQRDGVFTEVTQDLGADESAV
ncbi:MAG: hypothetical protein KAJ67_01670, partial [Gemmatimonadetes bacterium]|nr:hypothetical protein [Gemmatimonadota bacterium]